MQFRRTRRFIDDLEDLKRADSRFVEIVKNAFPEVSAALQGNVELFNKYTIKPMKGYERIWEGHLKYNLCFTFHYEKKADGEKICFFRRVGTHSIYNNP